MTRDTVSVEKVLNSRCSSDFDRSIEGLKKRHWGTLVDRHPSKETVNRILSCCNIPRLSMGKLLHWFRDEYLFLGFQKPDDTQAERVLHIESGMQQEAAYLACAALGVGTCIHNEGINGTEYAGKIATAKHLIMQITDPYKDGKYATKPPGPERPFRTGRNLTEPLRDGEIECLPELEHLTSTSKSGSAATAHDISQLLWAAKGRTPHLIRLHVWDSYWGLTIPTWAGRQALTSVYLLQDEGLFRYRNWTGRFPLINRLVLRYARRTIGNPTHDIDFVRNVSYIHAELNGSDTAIILCQNEKTNRALWEVGYMLENMFLQAKSLGISHESKIFSSEETSQLAHLGVRNAVAVLLL